VSQKNDYSVCGSVALTREDQGQVTSHPRATAGRHPRSGTGGLVSASFWPSATSQVEERIRAQNPAQIIVGLWYENFSQTSDEEVRELLNRAHMPVR